MKWNENLNNQVDKAGRFKLFVSLLVKEIHKKKQTYEIRTCLYKLYGPRKKKHLIRVYLVYLFGIIEKNEKNLEEEEVLSANRSGSLC